jgi:hypothetical protein
MGCSGPGFRKTNIRNKSDTEEIINKEDKQNLKTDETQTKAEIN